MPLPIYTSNRSVSGAPGEDAPTGATQVAGIDDRDVLRVLRTHSMGALRMRPDTYSNGVYGEIPLALNLRTVAGDRHAGKIADGWSYGSPLTTGGGSVQWSPITGDVEVALDGTTGRAMFLEDTGVMYTVGRGAGLRMGAVFDQPLAPGVRWEWGGFIQVGNDAPLGPAIGWYLQAGVLGIFARIEGIGTIDTPQAFFNVDKFDGTGPSGATITPANLDHWAEWSIWFDPVTYFRLGDKPAMALDVGNPATSFAPTPYARNFVVRPGFAAYQLAPTGIPTKLRTHAAYGDIGIGSDNIQDRSQPGTLPGADPVNINSGARRPVFTIRPALTAADLSSLNSWRVVPQVVTILSTERAIATVWLGDPSNILLTGENFVRSGGSAAETDTEATAATYDTGLGARRAMDFPLQPNIPGDIPLRDIFNAVRQCLTVRGNGQPATVSIEVFVLGATQATVTLLLARWGESI